MAGTQTLNIRGARLYEVNSTADTATSTEVSALVSIDTLPQASAASRIVTELNDTSVARLPGRLKDHGSFAYTLNLLSGSFNAQLGTSKILRLDIPADKVGTATSHEILRLWMPCVCVGEQPSPGGDTEDATLARTFDLNGAAVYGTATASII